MYSAPILTQHQLRCQGVVVRKPISVLLVEDHPLLRRELRRILDDDLEISVVGEAASGVQASELAERLNPDVVVMDLAMPVMDGIQATRRMLARNPATAVLILSMNSQESSIRKAFDAGVRGYVVKDAADLDLPDAVKDIASGKQVVCRGRAARV